MMEHDELARVAVDAAFKVHSHLGPGLLESVYEACLAREFDMRQIPYKRQMALPIHYEGLAIDNAYRLDLLLDDRLIIEVKAVEKRHPLYQAQLLTYMRLTRAKIGLLINFNAPRIKDGITRMVL